MATVYGYARCSTNEEKQDIQRQTRELEANGAETVRREFEHGDAATKKELDRLLNEMEAGDTLLTLEVSRLSRSTQQLCQIIEIVQKKHLKLQIVGSITINSLRFFFVMLASLCGLAGQSVASERVFYYNPDGGQYIHLNPRCETISSK